jgi:glycosyltransferase involved in cell wall biosynthesis
MQKTVSVVVTVFNLEKLIGLAINSILAQTIQPLEIIVVDDCSTDNSASIIKAYHSDIIKYLKMSENSGVLPATIEGIKEAKGEIICFLDGDDVWLPNKIEEVITQFNISDDIVFVTHNYEVIDFEGNILNLFQDRQKELSKFINNNPNLEAQSSALKKMIFTSNKIVSLGSAYSILKNSFNVEVFKNLCNKNFDKLILKNSVQDIVIATYVLATNQNKKAIANNKKLFQYRISAFNSSGKANDYQSALKSLQRHKATTFITHTIIKELPHLIKENKYQFYLSKEADFMINLYQKKYVKAFILFITLSKNLWNLKDTIKEFKRMVAVILLGPDKFFKIKSA